MIILFAAIPGWWWNPAKDFVRREPGCSNEWRIFSCTFFPDWSN